jgi:hypothetical protein
LYFISQTKRNADQILMDVDYLSGSGLTVPDAAPRDRMADAQALHAATLLLLAEGLEKGFHYFSLNLRVAIVELEDQMQSLAGPAKLAPLSDLPKSSRRTPRVSVGLRDLIRDKQP